MEPLDLLTSAGALLGGLVGGVVATLGANRAAARKPAPVEAAPDASGVFLAPGEQTRILRRLEVLAEGVPRDRERLEALEKALARLHEWQERHGPILTRVDGHLDETAEAERRAVTSALDRISAALQERRSDA